MNDTADILNKHKAKLAKLKKQFFDDKGRRRNTMGFNLDLYYGGNKKVDIPRISISDTSVAIGLGNPDPTLEAEFIDLLIRATNANIAFWEDAAAKEIVKLTEALNK